MKQPVKHFDLPKQHLIGEHYVPARARKSDEIERRRSLRPGTLLLEQQRDGLAIARHMIERAEERPDVQYLSAMLAAAAFNSSWYGFARQAPVMRRRLHLPQIVSETHDHRTTRSGLLEQVRNHTAATAEMASAYVFAHAGGYDTLRQSIELGRQMGNIGLELAAVPIVSSTYGLNPIKTQLAVRERGLEVLDDARALASEIGVNVSLAQLADADTDLSVHIRRTAPNGVHDSFEEATEMLRNAA